MRTIALLIAVATTLGAQESPFDAYLKGLAARKMRLEITELERLNAARRAEAEEMRLATRDLEYAMEAGKPIEKLLSEDTLGTFGFLRMTADERERFNRWFTAYVRGTAESAFNVGVYAASAKSKPALPSRNP